MKRAFTLIELLVIVAIMGTMVTVGVVSFVSGRASTSVFAAARDVMSVVRRARSTALVTQKDVVVIFSNGKAEDSDDTCAKVEIKAQKLFSAKKSEKVVETLAGDIIGEDGEARDPFKDIASRRKRDSESPTQAEEIKDDKAGETLEDVLAPTKISEEVMKGLKVKVLEIDETFVVPENETRKSKISIFSTAGAVARSYEAGKDDGFAASGPGAATGNKSKNDEDAENATEEPVEIVFHANGTVKPPHKIWIYPEETTPDKGLCIEVDRYGEPKCQDVEGL